MLGFKVLNLKTDKGKNLHYNKTTLIKLRIEIASLLKQLEDINVLDELTLTGNYETGKAKTNLIKGYNYILGYPQINKDSLKELYDILSDNLLDEESKKGMGDYYRKDGVFIMEPTLNTDIFTASFDRGLSANQIEEKMNSLFEYINNDNDTDIIEKYIKSQIIHFYFVYIHPYYDVNGRTARTLSTWYLLQQKADNLIVFNKGIYKNESKNSYAAHRCRNGNITYFLEFSLKVLKKELEEEIRMQKEENFAVAKNI